MKRRHFLGFGLAAAGLTFAPKYGRWFREGSGLLVPLDGSVTVHTAAEFERALASRHVRRILIAKGAQLTVSKWPVRPDGSAAPAWDNFQGIADRRRRATEGAGLVIGAEGSEWSERAEPASQCLYLYDLTWQSAGPGEVFSVLNGTPSAASFAEVYGWGYGRL